MERLDELPHAPEHDEASARERSEHLGAAEPEGEPQPARVRGQPGDGGCGGGGGEHGAAKEEAEGFRHELEASACRRQGSGGGAVEWAAYGGDSAQERKVKSFRCCQRGDGSTPALEAPEEDCGEEGEVEGDEQREAPAVGREPPELQGHRSQHCGESAGDKRVQRQRWSDHPRQIPRRLWRAEWPIR